MNTHADIKIHLIEDEEDIVKLIEFNARLAGYIFSASSTGEMGLNAIYREMPDLVLLDIMLPGLDGIEICQKLKDNPHTMQIPVIMISAKGEEEDIVRGLETGAADYITKPFSPMVLLARIKSVLKHCGRQKSRIITSLGKIKIDREKHRVTVFDKEIRLTHYEFSILRLLAERPGWVFTRQQIVDQIRGKDFSVTDRSIDFQMVGLRKKLGPEGRHIKTVRGVGYRLDENDVSTSN